MGTNTIAEYLNIEVADIREVRNFQYVYLVIFNIRRRPTFVSKREIAAREVLASIQPPVLDFTAITKDKRHQFQVTNCPREAKPAPRINSRINPRHQVISLSDPELYQSRTYQVLARTDIRRGRYDSRNRGLKIRDIETGEISWINNERPYDRDINKGDYVRFDGKILTLIKNGAAMAISF